MSLPRTNDNNELEDESQISWREGYIHGDPFEERVVVLSSAQRVILISNEDKHYGSLVAVSDIEAERHLVTAKPAIYSGRS